jgi:hypothetical protein
MLDASTAMSATSTPPTSPTPPPEGLQLRASPQLQSVPLHRRSPASAPGGPAATPVEASGWAGNSPRWLLVGLAALASAGWLLERRRRRELETDKDSVLWAGVQPPGSSIITELNAGEAADDVAASQPPLATRLPPTTAGARREATLTDLHELDGRLRRRRASGDLLAAVLLLQQHVADFRFTSPWVFLELRELYHLLSREREWELAREVFLLRFGQRAPLWQAPSTAEAQLADDPVICGEIVPCWPFREARVAMLRWVLGEPETPGEPYHPPVLALGVYRDLLFIDRLLDRVLITRPPAVDSLM